LALVAWFQPDFFPIPKSPEVFFRGSFHFTPNTIAGSKVLHRIVADLATLPNPRNMALPHHMPEWILGLGFDAEIDGNQCGQDASGQQQPFICKHGTHSFI
jgi:hypothetical protein